MIVGDFAERFDVAIDQGHILFSMPNGKLESAAVNGLGAREIPTCIRELLFQPREQWAGVLKEWQQIQRAR